MQTKKDEVKEQILECAKEEFLEKGFEKSSLRNIAKKAGVTKGNIYTYFPCKDSLFCELAKPALEFLMTESDENQFKDLESGMTVEEAFPYEKHRAGYIAFISQVYSREIQLRLLFFNSAGSSLENFRETVFSFYTKNTLDCFDSLKRAVPEFQNRITEMFFHSCADLFLRFIEEILIHSPNKTEAERYAEEMATFLHFGLKNVLCMQKQ